MRKGRRAGGEFLIAAGRGSDLVEKMGGENSDVFADQ